MSAPAKPVKRQRMAAGDRRQQLLGAARRAFSESGDITSTTLRDIAREAGVSEAIIYRHFASKEELFFEAVLEPLRDTMQRAIRGTHYPAIDPKERAELVVPFFSDLINELLEALPLIGLVLFGDPTEGSKFYQTSMAHSMDQLGDRLTEYYKDFGIDFPGRLVARAMVGMALMLAMEGRFNPGNFDTAEASSSLSKMIYAGLFPRRQGKGYVFDAAD